jgi:hypothetical protein
VNNPVEIGYFDRGPIDAKMLIMGGSWSAYWYNGKIYSSEIARGLDIFELTPTENLSQNEIDAAKAVRQSHSNVQTQEMIRWPNSLTVAKAYVDQLERSKDLPADKIASLRAAIADAEKTKLGKKEKKNLEGLAKSMSKDAAFVKSPAGLARFEGLVAILKKPVM